MYWSYIIPTIKTNCICMFQIPDDGKLDPSHLTPSKHPRFCNEIRYGAALYTKYFKLVFNNKTFRVYEVKPKRGSFSKNI